MVVKMMNGQKTIVTSAEMIKFREAYVEVITKSGKAYLVLTEK